MGIIDALPAPTRHNVWTSKLPCEGLAEDVELGRSGMDNQEGQEQKYPRDPFNIDRRPSYGLCSFKIPGV